jgi:O-antigen ligase
MAIRQPRGAQRVVHVEQQLRHDQVRSLLLFGGIALFTLIAGGLAYGSAPAPFSLAVVVLAGSAVAALLRPTIGVYLILFLTLVGDASTMPWWPFSKNMSSRESILFVADQMILNPMELMIAATAFGWILQRLADPTWRVWRGRMFWPMIVFTGFVILGLLYGKARGGDTRVAIFETRPLLYIFIVYLLVTNMFTTRVQYRLALIFSMFAVAIQSIFSLVHYSRLPSAERATIQELSEHGATIHMNALMIFLLAAWTLRCSARLRWTLTVLVVPVIWAFLLSQRRAAMIALVIGFVALVIVLFYRRRRAFWFVTPTALVLGVGYVLATWNAEGALGLPAQAVKSVFFTDAQSGKDASSDLYRDLEAINLWVTIRSAPETGIGFGHKFIKAVSMPDISGFEFWEYIPHNSVLWIWVQIGFLGFVAMLFMFARGVQRGSRSVIVVRDDEQAAVVLTGLAFVIMFLVFAYVDIAWTPRGTVFLAFAFALCADFEAAMDPSRRRVEGVHSRQLETVR